jgi:hypothetical protein
VISEEKSQKKVNFFGNENKCIKKVKSQLFIAYSKSEFPALS